MRFKASYGKKPYLVMVFVDWGRFINEEIVKDVYSQNCVLCLTWEPQEAEQRKGIDYDKILSGGYDQYIRSFAGKLKAVEGEVFLRFAHEMNGDWYPWSGIKIGRDKFKAIYRYVKDIFDSEGAENVKWVFSINWQNVPAQNDYKLYYPGPSYVDYIGIDGYNWGNTQDWSRWMSFRDIFLKTCREVSSRFNKPILISEFSSASSGGDKAKWIKEAMKTIKSMKKVRGFILFNVNKETDWHFPAASAAGKELKEQLKDSYFKENP
ncbi:MAG: hypothetical protein JSV30_00040 [Candidatus Omnitrophota bacterium]|nr:MAG: hypothetical protein JSV30_00040 [Candidatus Omnitrophota bacterium]